jgi:hypothetical protein
MVPTKLPWLGSADCYDFLNGIDLVGEIAGFWQQVDDWETCQDDPLARDKISEEIRRAARAFIDEFGSWQPGEADSKLCVLDQINQRRVLKRPRLPARGLFSYSKLMLWAEGGL